MSALHTSSQSKSWWSRSKSAKDPPSLRSIPTPPERTSIHSSAASKSTTGSKFNTFVASAIGKKPKKPTLTIQDPPPSISVRPSPSLTFRSGRSTAEQTPLNSPYSPHPPPSEFVQYYDVDQASDFHTISEPRTPSDHPRDRVSYQQSVLTFSDPDPFASSGGILFSPFAQDVGRSSVYSDNSLLDPNSKRPDMMYSNRISYGSSSSNSHSNPSDGHGARSVLSSAGRSQISRRPSEASSKMPERHRRQTSTGVESTHTPPSFTHPRNAPPPPTGSSSSHSTITDRNRRSTPSGGNSFSTLPRSHPPIVRPRGMTVGAAVRPSTASGGLGFATVSGVSSISPGPIRRKASETFSNGRTPSNSSSPISSSPITFTRTRSSSPDTSITTFPTSASISTSITRPVVLVRKASSSRLLVPPLNAAPPHADLPPTPPSPAGINGFMQSVDDMSELNFPEPPSSGSSNLSFASQIDMTELGGDGIHHFIRDSFFNRAILGEDPTLSPPATVKNFSVGSPPPSLKQSPSGIPSTPHKTLKKAISQSSLLGKRYSAASVASSMLSNEDPVPTPVKVPKKQRSFHHTRIPLPPLPSLRHTSSHNSNTSPISNSPSTPQPHTPEQRKPTTSPPQIRKRLFSGSSLRRNSQSQQQSPISPPSPDDDMRSLASVESTSNHTSNDRKSKPIMMSFSTFGNHVSLVTENACIAPAWDEPVSPPPPRRESQSEYVPQYIMSPEALLKLEEELAAEPSQWEKERGDHIRHESVAQTHTTPRVQLEPEDFGLQSPSRRPKSTRSRTNSALSELSTTSLAFGGISAVGSTSTISNLAYATSPRKKSTSTKTDHFGLGSDLEQARLGFRSNSVIGKAVNKPPMLNTRPSTAHASMSPPSSPSTVRHSSPERPSTALPPPPRPRPSRVPLVKELSPSTSNPYNRASVLPLHPLSPPPRRKNSQASAISQSSRERPAVQPSRPPSSFDQQKVLQRRSIMKKPSFLEIDDEMDNDSDNGMESLVDTPLETLTASPLMESSFLDLDRGNSFDSFRSDDDAIGVF